MKPQKMRRTLLLDIPRNVSRREYAIYSLQWGLVLFGFAGSAGVLLAAIRGDASRTITALEAIPALTIADAAVRSEGMSLVRLEGTLGANASVVMPDDPAVEVVLGSVDLIVKSTEGGGRSREAVLHRWEQVPDVLWLADGEARILLEVEPDRIPRGLASRVSRPERLTDGASLRLRRTVGYRYFDRDWPLPEEWGPVRSASVRVERSYVEAGAPFVAVGRLVPQKMGLDQEGAVLLVDQSSGGEVHAGTLQQIRDSSKQLGARMRFAWLPLLLGAIWLLVHVLRIRREFIQRSNEA